MKYFFPYMKSMKDKVEVEVALPLPLEAFRSETGTKNVGEGILRVTTVVSGVVCKLQSPCRRREGRPSDVHVRGGEPEPWGTGRTAGRGTPSHMDREFPEH